MYKSKYNEKNVFYDEIKVYFCSNHNIDRVLDKHAELYTDKFNNILPITFKWKVTYENQSARLRNLFNEIDENRRKRNETKKRELLSANPYAIHILENNIDCVDWIELSSNPNPNAIRLLEKNLDKVNVCWSKISANPNAIRILEKNLDKVVWCELSANPNAIGILEKNLDKVDWTYLSTNPNAIPILEKNLDKVCWSNISVNPNAIHILEHGYSQ